MYLIRGIYAKVYERKNSSIDKSITEKEKKVHDTQIYFMLFIVIINEFYT